MKKFMLFCLLNFIVHTSFSTELELLSIIVDTAAGDSVRYSLSTSKQTLLGPGSNWLPTSLWPLKSGTLLNSQNCLILEPNDPSLYGTIIIYKYDNPTTKKPTLYFVYKGSVPELDAYVTLNIESFEKNFNYIAQKSELQEGFRLDTTKPYQLWLRFNPLGSLDPISIQIKPWLKKGRVGHSGYHYTMDDLKKFNFNKANGILGTGFTLPDGIIPCKN